MNKLQVFLLIVLSCFIVLFIKYNFKPDIFTPISNPLITTPKETKIMLVGDVMLGRSVMTKSLALKDPLYAFRNVKDGLIGNDIIFANLEAPFVENCPITNSGMTFCAPPDLVQALTYAGINVVNLANNHILNYGMEGLKSTQKILGENQILYTGVNNLAIKEVNNIKFGFLGFDLVDNKFTASDQKLISESKNKTDVLIVSVHWGSEYQATASVEQKRVAREMVNSGADIIVGHHPHWVQDSVCIERTGSKLINPSGCVPVFYSLGNFVFDQMWSEETKKGLAVKLIYSGMKLVNQEQLPVYIPNPGQPEFVQ